MKIDVSHRCYALLKLLEMEGLLPPLEELVRSGLADLFQQDHQAFVEGARCKKLQVELPAEFESQVATYATYYNLRARDVVRRALVHKLCELAMKSVEEGQLADPIKVHLAKKGAI